MKIASLLVPLCLSLGACSGDPSGSAGALGGVRSKKGAVDHKADLKMSVQKPKANLGGIVAPDMIQKGANGIVAPDMIQKPGANGIVAPDMIQKPAVNGIVAPDMIQKGAKGIVAPDMVQKPLIGEDGLKP